MNEDKLIKELFENKEIKTFCEEHNIDKKTILLNLKEFFLYKDAYTSCLNCSNDNCTSNTAYMKPVLDYKEGIVKVFYDECFKKNNDGRVELLCAFNIKSLDVYKNDDRLKIFLKLNEFINNYEKGKFIKGVYLYGKFGVGKTYILYSFACKLAKKGHNVIFTYYPDLVRHLKSLISSANFEKTILKLKKVELLFLDDLGGENNTAFIRDEVFGPILQYRMDNNLPIFVTSNYSIEDLRKVYCDTSSLIELTKSTRINERIRYLTTEIELKDKDYRNN